MSEAEARRRDWLDASATSIASILERDVDAYLRPDLAALNFHVEEREIRDCFALLADLRSMPLHELPSTLLRSLGESLAVLAEVLRRIADFNAIRIADAGGRFRQDLFAVQKELAERMRAFWTSALSAVGYLSWTDSRAQTAPAERADFRRLVNEAKLLLAKLSREEESVGRALAAAQDQASLAVTQRFARVFEVEASEHKREADSWLKRAAWGVGITSLLAAVNVWLAWSAIPRGDGSDVFLSIAKVLLISLSISGTLWCARAYRAANHNRIVNRHRANALIAFEAFVEGSSDAQTKDAVRVIAAQSVFQPQSTAAAGVEPESVPASVIGLLSQNSPSRA